MKTETLRWLSALLFLGGLAGCPLDREADIGSDGNGDNETEGDNTNQGAGDCFRDYCPPGSEARPDAGPQPAPDPDAEPTCAERCAAAGAEASAECIATGAEPERCAAVGVAREGECRQRCVAEPPPPPPNDCAAACAERAQAAADRCAADGGDRARCAAVFEDAQTGCRAHCDAPPPAPADPCADACEERARQAGAECFEAGGGRERCMPLIDDVRVSCLASCTPAQPEPPVADCADRCAEVGAQTAERCVLAGGDRARCAAEGEAAQAACRERCAGAEPPPPAPHPCAVRCGEAASAERDRCLAEGQDPRRCDAFARDFEALCRTRCVGAPPPVECSVNADCPAGQACISGLCGAAPVECSVNADCPAGQACISGLCGAAAVECSVNADCPAGQACLAGQCSAVAECADRCELLARDRIVRCVAEGFEPEACRARFEPELAACRARCVEQPEPPAPVPADPCLDRCGEGAAQVLRACLAEGGGPDRCETLAREGYARCAAECQGEPAPPPPADACAVRCGELADQVRDRCLATGRERELCAREAAAAEADCRTRCAGAGEPAPEPIPEPAPPPEPACEDRCAANADAVHRACIEAGAGADRCALLARETYAQCTAAYCGRP